ncbi:uncharacterized protein TRIADDRAFT_57875 [Trichoplax adhaerens]|uniref:RING-type domain-containing protein n=1 Tax=Trichoplax adhaerens TaxID=10228 RepID=B3S1T2_TRIAD|nr:hypothetical protein TRIADDRAFT_57875 [Trichoplax adhaerens]EDV23029.1 hypothetical protein TRIADDRAFT_57875 [Trichoplax adhaerens]|eukprot:XP_002113939.1 hypothetical protein TRIADDRAFT_57875 [Trichoplax adhaerens]
MTPDLSIYRCRLCRYVLWDATSTCENERLTDTNLVYLPIGEHHIPSWINKAIENASWTKGKLNCPKCNGRVGAFDFISSVNDRGHYHNNQEWIDKRSVWMYRNRVDKFAIGESSHLPDAITANSSRIPASSKLKLFKTPLQTQRNRDTDETHHDSDGLLRLDSFTDNGKSIVKQPTEIATANTEEGVRKVRKGKKRQWDHHKQNVRHLDMKKTSNEFSKCSNSEVIIKTAEVVDEIASTGQNIPENMICPVCLDIYYRPYRCNCGHIFCDFCIRLLAKNKLDNSDPNVLCPLCRQSIKYIDDCKELKEKIKQQFEKSYIRRRIEIRRALKSTKLVMPFNKGKLGFATY